MDAAVFLEHLFGDTVSPSETISIWSLPSKTGRWYPSVARAAERAAGVSPAEDVYFGCGLYRNDIQGSGRGKAADVTCITSLWADVDYGPTHAKEGTPPSIVEAMKVVDRVGLPPSIVIDSGYGLHVYWLLTEALAVADDAATISRRWGATVLECAKCLGHIVDSVHDISRVMRVPGTLNRKHLAVKPVVYLPDYSKPSTRYDVSDIENILVDESVSTANASANVHVSAVILNLGRSPSANLIEALCANDPKAKKTWDKKRTDLPDQSASSYDMALAHIGAQMEMDDQDIADLIIAWRVKHAANPQKAMRQSYMQMTIAKARVERKKNKAIESLGSVVIPPGAGQSDTAKERQAMLDTLSSVFGVKVSQWIQHGTENAEFSLVLADGTDVLIGTAADVLKQQSFRIKLLELGMILPKVKAKAWDSVIAALTRLREVVVNPDGSRMGQVEDWLASYMGTVVFVVPKGDKGDIIHNSLPFKSGGYLFIHSSHLAKHVTFALQERIGKRKLAGMLRIAGWARETVSGSIKNSATGQSGSVTRSYWKMRE